MEPQPKQSLLRYLPQVAAATLAVVGGSVLAITLLRLSGVVTSTVPLIAAGVAASIAISYAGAAYWRTRPGSGEILFADLMVWGWIRRWRIERRLSSAARAATVRLPIARPVVPALCALALLLIVPVAGAEPPAPAVAAPLIGYNDNFNNYELTRRNTVLDTLPPGVPLDPSIPLPGEKPPVPEAAGEEAIQNAARGGADVVRYVVPWMRVERKQGVYDFGVDDQTYDLVLEAGLKPLIVIMTSPCWAHPSVPCNEHRAVRPDAQHIDDFARFAKATIERYPEAAAFEIWNESNFKAFWGTTPSPAGYVRLLKAVAEQVATVVPAPTLLYNGLIPKKGWERYMERSYMRKDAGLYADGTALHPYVGGGGVTAVKRQLNEAMLILRRSDSPRKVWVTEIGWSTNPEAEGAVGPEGQAERVQKLLGVAAKMRLPSVIVHRLQDLDHDDPWESGLGALRRNDSAKPLFCMLRAHRPRGAAPSGC